MSTKILTRTIILVSMVSLFTDVASEMLYPVMPVYLRSIGFSVLMIGILEGLAEAVAGLSKGYFGNLSDVLAKRVPFVRIGYAMSAVAKPMMALFIYPLWIFFARTLDRLGKGIRTSARDAILSDEALPEHKGRVFGFHRSMDTLGAAIGPALALIFLVLFPAQYKWLFIIAVIPGLIAVLLTFLIRDKSKGQYSARESVSFFTFLKYWDIADNQYKKLVVGLLAFTLFNSSDAFLLLALKLKGYSDVVMIGFYIFYNLCYALLSYPVGILADKIGLKRVFVAGLILFAMVYGTISFVDNFVLLGIVFGVYGVYASATEGVSKALISNLSDKKDTATAIGFYSCFSSLFALLASSIGGFIWFIWSPVTMFLISSVGVLVLVFYLLVIVGMKKFG